MSRTYERFAGACAVAAAIGGIGYSIAFMTYLKSGSTAAAKVATILLLGGGVVVTAVLIAVFGRIRQVDAGFAVWAVALGGVNTGVGARLRRRL